MTDCHRARERERESGTIGQNIFIADKVVNAAANAKGDKGNSKTACCRALSAITIPNGCQDRMDSCAAQLLLTGTEDNQRITRSWLGENKRRTLKAESATEHCRSCDQSEDKQCYIEFYCLGAAGWLLSKEC